MKNKEFVVANLLMLIFIVGSASLTFSIFSNESLSSIFHLEVEKNVKPLDFSSQIGAVTPAVPDVTNSCSKESALMLNHQNDPHIKRLATYQDVCGSLATKKMMFFTDFPYSNGSAYQSAAFMIKKLKIFKENGISPIVIAEPYVGENPMSYKAFLGGEYDQDLETYFMLIKEGGITDEMMGMWVPFPESNTPNWNNKDTEPKDFALAVNKYLGILKRHFPDAQGSVLLNAATYEPDDLEWNNGDYLNFTPYLTDIDKGLVDSFGIQGFPWVSNATVSTRQIFRATEFLQPDLAISAAQELRTKDIWINTGTFASKYTDDETRRAEVSLNERKSILNGILDTAQEIRNYQLNEYRVSINLFSENKSTFAEATDWSYFQNSDSEDLMKGFLRKAETLEIPVSLFDIEHVVKPTPAE